MRPEWDEIWMDFCTQLQKILRSVQVGAVIVSEDNCQVLAIGYNGNYAGGPNEVESSNPNRDDPRRNQCAY